MWVILIFLASVALGQSFRVTGKAIYEAKAPVGAFQGVNSTLQGQVKVNLAQGEASGEVCLDLAAWDSKEPLRDRHTRDMFEVNRFPKACLRLTGLEALGQGQEREAVAAGLLNLHGVERPLKVKGTLRQEGNLYRFRGSFLLRLGDYGLKAPTFLGMRVAEEVKVWVEVEAR